jgi:hypothetical protein
VTEAAGVVGRSAWEVTMGKVGRFVTDPKAGAFCQITLDSGEKILVSHDKGIHGRPAEHHHLEVARSCFRRDALRA